MPAPVPDAISGRRPCGHVYEYRLTDAPALWLVMIAAGCGLAEAEKTVKMTFGADRFLCVRRKHEYRGAKEGVAEGR